MRALANTSQTLRPALRSTGVALVALLTIAAECSDSEFLGGFKLPTEPPVLEEMEIFVPRTAQVRVRSLDGNFEIEIPPFSVTETTTLTLSRIRLSLGDGVEQIAYRLDPDGLIFEQPVRISLQGNALPTPRSPDVRVARYGAELGEWWVALDRPQAASGMLLGRTRRTGTFAAADPAVVQVQNIDPFPETSEADVLLSRGEVEAAQAAYSSLLNRRPENVAARLGRAVSTLLLVPTTTPVRNALARCQLPPLSASQLYGDDGYLERLALDRTGDAQLTLDFAGSPTASLGEGVISRAEGGWVTVRVEDHDHMDGPWTLTVSINLAAAGELYAFGSDLAASSFPGTIALSSPSAQYRASAASVGEVHVDAAGRAPGQEVAFSFNGLTVIGEGGVLIRLGGRVSDLLASPPIPLHLLFTTGPDAGPPHREPLAVLLESCGDAFSAGFLWSQLVLVVEDLDSVAEDLRVVVDAVDGGGEDPDVEDSILALQRAVPSFLLRSADDLALSVRDLRLIIATIHGLDAIADLLQPYRLFGYAGEGTAVELTSFLEEQELAFTDADGVVATRAESAFSAALVASNISQNLLRTELESSELAAWLAPVRGRLATAIDEALAGLQQPVDHPGLLQLDAPRVAAFTAGMIEALGAARQSISAGAPPVAAPANPGYSYHLSALFDSPPTRGRLVEGVGGEALVLAQSGDPEASSASARNPSLALAPGLVDALLASYLALPPDPPGEPCAHDVDCGAVGLHCDFTAGWCAESSEPCGRPSVCEPGGTCMGRCAREPFSAVAPFDLERAVCGEAPAYLHPDLWRAVAPLSDALPRPRLSFRPLLDPFIATCQ